MSLSSRLVAVRFTVTGRAERWDRNALRASIYPYWLAGATTTPGDDLEVRQPPTLTLEGPHPPRGHDLRDGDHWCHCLKSLGFSASNHLENLKQIQQPPRPARPKMGILTFLS